MPKVRKNTAAIDLIDKIEPLNENFATFQRPSTEYTEKGAKSFHARLTWPVHYCSKKGQVSIN